MTRSLRLRVCSIVLVTLLRFAFASAPSFQLNLARYNNSPVHSTKGTPSPFNGLWLFVSIRFQDLFHSAPTVLFIFPSRYWFTIGHMGVFSLAGWSRLLPAGFHVPRRTQDPARCALLSSTGLAPSSAGLSMPFDWLRTSAYRGPSTPILRSVWAPPLSLATTYGIILIFFSSGY